MQNKFNLLPKKSWIIFDGRAWDDPDSACVYCAYDSCDKTLEDVKKDRAEFWEDGVIFEYDQDIKKVDGQFITYIINKRFIG